MKYYRVSHNGVKKIMPANEVSVLQQSGSKIKILRRATQEEYINQGEICIHINSRIDSLGNTVCANCGVILHWGE